LFNESSLLDSIRAVATDRHVRFEFNVEHQNLVCDEKIIRNIFRRIAHNAAKFAKPNTNVQIEGRTIDRGLFRLNVTNIGTPIDENKIAQLMKPFTLNENMMNHSVGTGLGLAICQALLKLHGSQLSLKSTDDTIAITFDLSLEPKNG
jgi:K+-sensing histidine kinase KdpD